MLPIRGPAVFEHPRATWIDPSNGIRIDEFSLMHEMAMRQVVLLGETHTIAEIHRWGTPFQLRDLGIPSPAVLLPATGRHHNAVQIDRIADAIFRLDETEPASPGSPENAERNGQLKSKSG